MGGRLLNSTGLRLGIVRNWNSIWISKWNNYGELVKSNLNLKKFFKGVLFYYFKQAKLITYKFIKDNNNNINIFIFFFSFKNHKKFNNLLKKKLKYKYIYLIKFLYLLSLKKNYKLKLKKIKIKNLTWLKKISLYLNYNKYNNLIKINNIYHNFIFYKKKIDYLDTQKKIIKIKQKNKYKNYNLNIHYIQMFFIYNFFKKLNSNNSLKSININKNQINFVKQLYLTGYRYKKILKRFKLKKYPYKYFHTRYRYWRYYSYFRNQLSNKGKLYFNKYRLSITRLSKFRQKIYNQLHWNSIFIKNWFLREKRKKNKKNLPKIKYKNSILNLINSKYKLKNTSFFLKKYMSIERKYELNLLYTSKWKKKNIINKKKKKIKNNKIIFNNKKTNKNLLNVLLLKKHFFIQYYIKLNKDKNLEHILNKMKLKVKGFFYLKIYLTKFLRISLNKTNLLKFLKLNNFLLNILKIKNILLFKFLNLISSKFNLNIINYNFFNYSTIQKIFFFLLNNKYILYFIKNNNLYSNIKKNYIKTYYFNLINNIKKYNKKEFINIKINLFLYYILKKNTNKKYNNIFFINIFNNILNYNYNLKLKSNYKNKFNSLIKNKKIYNNYKKNLNFTKYYYFKSKLHHSYILKQHKQLMQKIIENNELIKKKKFKNNKIKFNLKNNINNTKLNLKKKNKLIFIKNFVYSKYYLTKKKLRFVKLPFFKKIKKIKSIIKILFGLKIKFIFLNAWNFAKNYIKLNYKKEIRTALFLKFKRYFFKYKKRTFLLKKFHKVFWLSCIFKNPKFLADYIGFLWQNYPRRLNHLSLLTIIKKYIKIIFNFFKEFLSMRLIINGRFYRRRRSKSYFVRNNSVSLTNYLTSIEYGQSHSVIKNGMVGIKIWFLFKHFSLFIFNKFFILYLNLLKIKTKNINIKKYKINKFKKESNSLNTYYLKKNIKNKIKLKYVKT